MHGILRKSLVKHKRFAKEHTHVPSSPHRLEHPGGPVDQPDAVRSRRGSLARRQPRRHGHLPRPGRRSVPHLGPAAAQARFVPPDQHNEAQAAAWAVSVELIGEVSAADTVLLGLPLYNFGPASTVKSWVDHLVAPGLSIDPASGDGQARWQGDDRAPGPRRRLRRGHAARGLGPRPAVASARGVSLTGLEPRFITAELTLADVNPADGRPARPAAASLKAAEAEVDALWATSAVA